VGNVMEVRKEWMRGVEREEWRWFKRYGIGV
jgi:hypothetical protein